MEKKKHLFLMINALISYIDCNEYDEAIKAASTIIEALKTEGS